MIKDKIFELEHQVEKQSMHIRKLTKMAIHLEEEVQKKSLRGIKKSLLGESLEVPKELTDTLAEIPEEPKVVKPLVLPSDIVEDEKSKETKGPEKAPDVENKVVEKTKIQKIVEEHYARPVAQSENSGKAIKDTSENIKVTEGVKPESESGVVLSSVDFLLSNLYSVKENEE